LKGPDRPKEKRDRYVHPRGKGGTHIQRKIIKNQKKHKHKKKKGAGNARRRNGTENPK